MAYAVQRLIVSEDGDVQFSEPEEVELLPQTVTCEKCSAASLVLSSEKRDLIAAREYHKKYVKEEETRLVEVRLEIRKETEQQEKRLEQMAINNQLHIQTNFERLEFRKQMLLRRAKAVAKLAETLAGR